MQAQSEVVCQPLAHGGISVLKVTISCKWRNAMADENAFQQGYDAYWDGVDGDDNPFISETLQYYSWDEGWSQAELEDEEPDSL